MEWRDRDRSAGVFPFSLGRKTIMLAVHEPHFFAELDALLPGHLLDGQRVARESAGVISHDSFPLTLSDKVDAHEARFAQANFVLTFVRLSFFFVSWASHQKG